MSLSARDRHSLDWIEAELARSVPKLAGMLAAYTALAGDEAVPGPQTVPGGILRRLFRLRRDASPDNPPGSS